MEASKLVGTVSLRNYLQGAGTLRVSFANARKSQADGTWKVPLGYRLSADATYHHKKFFRYNTLKPDCLQRLLAETIDPMFS